MEWIAFSVLWKYHWDIPIRLIKERGSETDGGRAPSGFCIRKLLWDYNQSTFHDRPANYAYLRMAEIHLAYAEALNETKKNWTQKVHIRLNTRF